MRETIFEYVHKECDITLYRRFVPINVQKEKCSYIELFASSNDFDSSSDKNQNFAFRQISLFCTHYDKKYNYFNNTNYLITGNISHSFRTSNSNVIKKLYPDPFADITSYTIYHKIIKDGDKIKLIKKQYTSRREANKKYFSKFYTVTMLVFNTTTNNITACLFNKHGKKIDKEIRVNCFNFIESICYSFYKDRPGYDEWRDAILNELAIDIGNPNSIFDYFIKAKQIKVPDNYYELLKLDYPGQKYLKKNDNKLALAILDKNGIKSKRTNKLLNIYPKRATLWYMNALIKLFGMNYIQYIKDVKVSTDGYFYAPNLISYPNDFISHIEKMNLINFINEKNNKISAIQMVQDHLKMLQVVKDNEIKFKIKASTIDEFNAEHTALTQICTELRKDTHINVIYNEKLAILEEPILYNNIIYTPVILREEYEYISESQIMHHCVSSYIERDKSLIISLRKNDEQITIEYDTTSGDLVQKRSYCNDLPPEHFNEPVDILSKKVKILSKEGILKRIETKFIKKIKTVENIEENIFTEIPF